MRFKFLSMEDFRGTPELRIDFEPDLTVIVGRNGAGKTSILDALGEFARLIRSHLKLGRRRGMNRELSARDVRFGTSAFALGLTFDFEEELSASEGSDSLNITFSTETDTAHYKHSDRLTKWSDAIQCQPRFIYYRQSRGFETRNRGAVGKSDRTFDPEAIQDLSLDEDLRAIGDLETWWDDRDAEEARIVRDRNPNYRDPQLQAIRSLVTKIDGFSGISFSSTASPPGLQLIRNDRAVIHVSRLSGGERSYIILLADLARRLQVFAPESALEQIPAIVLIDEIELNLHPAWQSQIAPALASVFKGCQFIITTHSPQVISSLHSKNVRVINQDPSGHTEVDVPKNTKGRTSNYLLEGVFHARERYPPIDRLVDEFNLAMDRRDLATAEARLASIESEIEGDPPTLLVLRKRLRKLRDDK